MSITKYILLTLSLMILLLIAWHTMDILLLTFAGGLFAIFIRYISNQIVKYTRLPDKLAVTATLMLLTVFSFILILTVTPTISAQITKLYYELPNAYAKINHYFKEVLDVHPDSFLQVVDFNKILLSGSNVIFQAANFFTSTFGIMWSFIFFLFIGIFLAYEPDTYTQGVLNLLPSENQSKAKEVLDSSKETLEWWIIGKLISMCIVGVLTGFGLWLLKIPLAFSLGFFAGLMTFIPNVGPIISAVPAIMLAITQNFTAAVNVTILYIAVQTLESYIITPIVQKKTISQPPAIIIFVQLIMAILTGILGLALAAPLLAVAAVLINKLYIPNKN